MAVNTRISRLSHDITVRDHNTLLSANGIGKVFSGKRLNDGYNLNNLIEQGVYRYSKNNTNIPSSSSILGVDWAPGYVVVHAINPDYSETLQYHYEYDSKSNSYFVTTDTKFIAGKNYYTRSGSGTTADPYKYTKATVTAGDTVPTAKITRYRQIAYPDNTNIIMTRYGIETSNTVSTIIWSDWSPLGGGTGSGYDIIFTDKDIVAQTGQLIYCLKDGIKVTLPSSHVDKYYVKVVVDESVITDEAALTTNPIIVIRGNTTDHIGDSSTTELLISNRYSSVELIMQEDTKIWKISTPTVGNVVDDDIGKYNLVYINSGDTKTYTANTSDMIHCHFNDITVEDIITITLPTKEAMIASRTGTENASVKVLTDDTCANQTRMVYVQGGLKSSTTQDRDYIDKETIDTIELDDDFSSIEFIWKVDHWEIASPFVANVLDGANQVIATKERLGCIIVGDNLDVTNTGLLSVKTANTEQKGVIQVTNSNGLNINNGVISMYAADANTVGTTKVGATDSGAAAYNSIKNGNYNLTVNANGTVRTNTATLYIDGYGGDEGGELVLASPTSGHDAIHIDNYKDIVRIFSDIIGEHRFSKSDNGYLTYNGNAIGLYCKGLDNNELYISTSSASHAQSLTFKNFDVERTEVPGQDEKGNDIHKNTYLTFTDKTGLTLGNIIENKDQFGNNSFIFRLFNPSTTTEDIADFYISYLKDGNKTISSNFTLTDVECNDVTINNTSTKLVNAKTLYNWAPGGVRTYTDGTSLDFNDYTTPGLYWIGHGNTMTNCPDDLKDVVIYGILEVTSDNFNEHRQILYIQPGADSNKIYTRGHNSNGWYNWKTFSFKGHTHAISDVTNLQTTLNKKLETAVTSLTNGTTSITGDITVITNNGLVFNTDSKTISMLEATDEQKGSVLLGVENGAAKYSQVEALYNKVMKFFTHVNGDDASYMTIGDLIVIQYGKIIYDSTKSTTKTITFSMAFADNSYKIVGTCSTAKNILRLYEKTSTAVTFEIYNNGGTVSSTGEFDWIAIGSAIAKTVDTTLSAFVATVITQYASQGGTTKQEEVDL